MKKNVNTAKNLGIKLRIAENYKTNLLKTRKFVITARNPDTKLKIADY